jgi:hypothetical protein
MDQEVWEPPADDASLAEKLAFQRRLKEHAEDPMNGPASMPFIKGEENMDGVYRWWWTPYDPPPRKRKTNSD